MKFKYTNTQEVWEIVKDEEDWIAFDKNGKIICSSKTPRKVLNKAKKLGYINPCIAHKNLYNPNIIHIL